MYFSDSLQTGACAVPHSVFTAVNHNPFPVWGGGLSQGSGHVCSGQADWCAPLTSTGYWIRWQIGTTSDLGALFRVNRNFVDVVKEDLLLFRWIIVHMLKKMITCTGCLRTTMFVMVMLLSKIQNDELPNWFLSFYLNSFQIDQRHLSAWVFSHLCF